MENLYNKAYLKTCDFLIQTIERKHKFANFNIISYWKIEQKMGSIDIIQDAIRRAVQERVNNEN